MYRAVGDDGLTFLPGAMQPRPNQPPKLIEFRRAPPKLKEAPLPKESTPATVPTLVTEEPPTTEPGAEHGSRTALYIAAGGVVLIGAVWLFTRK